MQPVNTPSIFKNLPFPRKEEKTRITMLQLSSSPQGKSWQRLKMKFTGK
jgi:hypothetical protein